MTGGSSHPGLGEFQLYVTFLTWKYKVVQQKVITPLRALKVEM